MDMQGIMAMLMGIVRIERFCDAAILSACKSGVIVRWLLAANGMLVKRQLVVTDDVVFIGFKEAEWTEKFKSIMND